MSQLELYYRKLRLNQIDNPYVNGFDCLAIYKEVCSVSNDEMDEILHEMERLYDDISSIDNLSFAFIEHFRNIVNPKAIKWYYGPDGSETQ